MKPFITIVTPSGATYQVPSFVVRDNVIAYRKSQGDMDDVAVVYADDLLSEASGLLDWAKNNMNWSELGPFARLTGFVVADAQEDFLNASLSVDDEAKPPISLESDDVLSYPVHALISSLAAHDQIASTLLISGPDESIDHKLALTLVQGPKKIVDGYIAVSQQFTNYLRNEANNAAAQADAAKGTNLPTTN